MELGTTIEISAGTGLIKGYTCEEATGELDALALHA